MASRREFLGGLASSGLLACGGARGPKTAAETGFTLPAEWAPHAGCLMQFPPALNYCSAAAPNCDFIADARVEWGQVARAIARFEPVVVYARPDELDLARHHCGPDVTLVGAPLSDGWSRDTGPQILTHPDGRAKAACFGFNGWGGSAEYADDAEIKYRMAEDLGLVAEEQPMILEGGAVMVDGTGRLVTTASCLLHPSRNPDLSQADQERILAEVLGVTDFIWVEQGWVPDPLTNGHIDGIAAFIGPGRCLVNSLDAPGDPNVAILQAAKARLQAAGIEVLDLPATSLTAFHINFYLANGAVIVPIEGRAAVDDAPLAILRDLHPDREVVGVVTNTLGRAGGGIHCITQQVPAAVTWPY